MIAQLPSSAYPKLVNTLAARLFDRFGNTSVIAHLGRSVELHNGNLIYSDNEEIAFVMCFIEEMSVNQVPLAKLIPLGQA